LGKGLLFAVRINYGYTVNDRATKTPGELRMIRIFTDVTLFPVGYLIHDKWESSDGAPS
jgi:hypothetical protein